MSKSIGIIGNGFVGEALAFAFSSSHNVKIYDIIKSKSIDSLDKTLDTDFVFVCLPTPMNDDGSQNISFINNFFDNNHDKQKPIYIIKSTEGKIKTDEIKFSKDAKPVVDELGKMGWTAETWKKQGANFAIKEMQENKTLDRLIASKGKKEESKKEESYEPQSKRRFDKASIKPGSDSVRRSLNYTPQSKRSTSGGQAPPTTRPEEKGGKVEI